MFVLLKRIIIFSVLVYSVWNTIKVIRGIWKKNKDEFERQISELKLRDRVCATVCLFLVTMLPGDLCLFSALSVVFVMFLHCLLQIVYLIAEAGTRSYHSHISLRRASNK